MEEQQDRFAGVDKRVLDIRRLVHVLNACQECAVNWNPVGLYLGLSQSLLNEIAAQTIQPRERLRKVLEAWLQQNTIPGSALPSYYTLCWAIERENPALAERIAEAHPAATNDGHEGGESDSDMASIGSAGYYTDEELNRLCRCGNCSLQQIITVGCPAIEVQSMSRFPLLDITRLPPGRKQQYLYMIEKEGDSINSAYSELYDCISESMTSIDVTRMKQYVKNMKWFSKATDNCRNTFYDRLELCQDIRSIFLVLAGICSWFNHHPLQSLVLMFGTEQLQTRYNDFVQQTLLPFLKRSITEIPKDGFGDVVEGTGVFRLKLDSNAAHENIRGDHIYFLKVSVAEALEISPEHLHIVSISAGCIEVTFMIPYLIYEEMFPLSVKHTQALQTIAVSIDRCEPLTVYRYNYYRLEQVIISKKSDNSSVDLSFDVLDPPKSSTPIVSPSKSSHGPRGSRSVTTVGGCSFDDLCRGVRNYACDTSCLIDLRGEDNAQKAVSRICQKLDENFLELEIQRDGEIGRFYIGKTFIRKRRKHGRGFQQFDPMNPNTWKKNGISSRWGQHKKTEYGSDGMIVLAAVTKETVPEGHRTQQDYALMLEQKLIHHYYSDSRLANETSGEGRREKAGSIAYALYVAFRLKSNMTSDGNRDDSELALLSQPSTGTITAENTSRTLYSFTPSLKLQPETKKRVPELSETSCRTIPLCTSGFQSAYLQSRPELQLTSSSQALEPSQGETKSKFSSQKKIGVSAVQLPPQSKPAIASQHQPISSVNTANSLVQTPSTKTSQKSQELAAPSTPSKLYKPPRPQPNSANNMVFSGTCTTSIRSILKHGASSESVMTSPRKSVSFFSSTCTCSPSSNSPIMSSKQQGLTDRKRHTDTDTSIAKIIKQTSEQSSDGIKTSTTRELADVKAITDTVTTSMATGGQNATPNLERNFIVTSVAAVRRSGSPAQNTTMSASRGNQDNNDKGKAMVIHADPTPISSQPGLTTSRKRPRIPTAENMSITKKSKNEHSKSVSSSTNSTIATTSTGTSLNYMANDRNNPPGQITAEANSGEPQLSAEAGDRLRHGEIRVRALARNLVESLRRKMT